MERLDTNVRALDGAFQETPEVLQAVRVDRAIDIGFGVVNHFVSVLVKAVIGLQRIGVKFRSGLHVLADDFVKLMLSACTYNGRANLASLTVEKSEYDSL